jgi:malate dehydrogenase
MPVTPKDCGWICNRFILKMSLLQKLDNKLPINVLVTGCCGQIAYNLVFLIARGSLFGFDQPIALHLLDIPAFESKLEALVLELEDLASPVLTKIVPTTDYAVAFSGVDVAILVGARPRGPGMERKDLLEANAAIFKGQGDAIEKYASRDVKVLVVGNPANTNALITSMHAPSIPKSNFSCLTRLDENRARSLLARRLNANVGLIRNVIIWGNHSTTQYPDVRFATLEKHPRPQDSASVAKLINDKVWLETDFITTIQQRGKTVIDKRGASSAASAAEAIVNAVHDWILGSEGRMISMGVYVVNSIYNIPTDLVVSVPVVTYRGGGYDIVKDLSLDEFSKTKIDASVTELLEEKAFVIV